MPIEWTQDLATGIEEIDAQHRELYAAIANLHDAMRYGELARAAVVLHFLDRYVRDHFSLEERWMASAKYPRFKEHAELHRAFVADFLLRREQFDASGPRASLVVDLADWLGGWLRDHIRRVDVEMGQFIRAAARR
jgi:hemerythrin-like metal-binding protein